jgi:hypothetical protein
MKWYRRIAKREIKVSNREVDADEAIDQALEHEKQKRKHLKKTRTLIGQGREYRTKVKTTRKKEVKMDEELAANWRN